MWPSEVLIEEDFTVSLSQELQRSNLMQKERLATIEKKKYKDTDKDKGP